MLAHRHLHLRARRVEMLVPYIIVGADRAAADARDAFDQDRRRGKPVMKTVAHDDGTPVMQDVFPGKTSASRGRDRALRPVLGRGLAVVLSVSIHVHARGR